MFKTFFPGDLLTADDANALMEQGTLVVADAAERDTIPAAEGMRVYRLDNHTTEQYTPGGNWAVMTRAVLSITAVSQSIPNNVITDVVYGSNVPLILGEGISMDPATGVASISIPGLYRCQGQGVWIAGGSVASHYVMLSRNDATAGPGAAMAALSTTNVNFAQQTEAIFDCAAGDTIRLKAYQGSGAAKNLGVPGASYYTTLTIERLTA